MAFVNQKLMALVECSLPPPPQVLLFGLFKFKFAKQMMEDNYIEYSSWSLDDLLVGFAKFTIQPELLFDEKVKQDAAIVRRRILCHQAWHVRNWSPRSCKTYVNALACIVKESGHPKIFAMPCIFHDSTT